MFTLPFLPLPDSFYTYQKEILFLLASWASGIPVIASNVGGLGRLIENGKTGFLFQVNDISSAIDAFYAAQSRRDVICQNAYKLCAEKY